MTSTLIYLIVGSFSGFCSGLFGIGGGLVMVPALIFCFTVAGIPAQDVPAMALGTSLACIAFVSALASLHNLRNGNLESPANSAMLVLVACVGLGVVAGSSIATRMPRSAIASSIAVFQLATAAWMAQRALAKPSPNEGPPPTEANGIPAQNHLRPYLSRLFMALTGFVSAIGGIGGATLMIPYLTFEKVDYRKAAALSTFLGAAIGLAGFASYALIDPPSTPIAHCIGYVNLPALAGLALGSVYPVKVGAALSRKMSKKTLTLCFCAFLFASASKLLIPIH